MRVIYSDNYKASGIETLWFPGGEPHARIPKDFGDALLVLNARTWNDVGLALCVLDALHQQSSSETMIWAFIPYFPGARQDRTDYQTPVTALMMMDLFKYYTTELFTFDAHSDVVAKRVTHNYMPSDIEMREIFDEKYRIIIPDAGAKDRCQDFNMIYGGSSQLVQCEKKRDFATGKFEGFTMPPLPAPGDYLIVDDICDGGGTFNLLAQEFAKDKYAAESTLSLWVSHGIFSRGLGNIDPLISKIYTTDSWYSKTNRDARNFLTLEEDPRLKVISLQPIIAQILVKSQGD